VVRVLCTGGTIGSQGTEVDALAGDGAPTARQGVVRWNAGEAKGMAVETSSGLTTYHVRAVRELKTEVGCPKRSPGRCGPSA